jgi:DNA-binding NtrC family response regulator
VTATGKILVVDDHSDLAENIVEILQGAGREAVLATSAEQALELVAAGDIHGLITDFRLPGLSGAQLIAELRRRGSNVPAVVMSAYTDDDTIVSAQAAGALEVLAKPVDIGHLLALVNQLGRTDDLVLVVDDNQALAENLAEALTSQGHRVITSSTMADALARRTGVGLAIIDFRLPDGSGVQVAEQLTAVEPGVRLLFVSAHGDEMRSALGERFPTAQTMDKPVNVAQLLAWVDRALPHGPTRRPDR